MKRLRLSWIPRIRASRDESPLLCREAVELVTDYLEGALADADRARFEYHLARCPNCAEYLAQIKASVALAGRADPAELSPQARTELTGLFRDWLADRGGES
jgi:anti-sigma factor RsiW